MCSSVCKKRKTAHKTFRVQRTLLKPTTTYFSLLTPVSPHSVMSQPPVAATMTYQTVESSDLPPTRWSDGTFECINDPQVCVLGACPMGCVQYLYAVSHR